MGDKDNVYNMRGDPLTGEGSRNEEIVEFCEKMLKDAKNGHIKGMVSVVFMNNSPNFHEWCGSFTDYEAIGSFELVKYDLIRRWTLEDEG